MPRKKKELPQEEPPVIDRGIPQEGVDEEEAIGDPIENKVEVPKVSSKYKYPDLESENVRIGQGWPIHRHPLTPQTEAYGMYEYFRKMPKVPFYCPMNLGEAPGAWQWYQINTFAMEIKKGTMVQIPRQIAEELMESLKTTSDAIHPIVMSPDGPTPANLADKTSTKEFER